MNYNEEDIKKFQKEHEIDIGIIYNKYIKACEIIGIAEPLEKVQILPYYMTIFYRYASWREELELIMEQEDHIIDSKPPLMFYVLHKNKNGCIIIGALKIKNEVKLSIANLDPDVINKLEN